MVKFLWLVVLVCCGCTKTVESNVNTEVYPHNPEVINKVNLGVTYKGTW